MPARAITRATLLEATAWLARQAADLACVRRLHGPPPLWARRPGFATLVKIILEQQVSLASASSMFAKLEGRAVPLTPERVHALGTARLRALGLTRQKTRYVLELARALTTGRLNLRGIGCLDDADVRAELMRVSGVGPWTADIYLVMALRRADVWPVADLAPAKSAQVLKRLPRVPTQDELQRIAAPWSPWRAVEARMLWHYYLCGFDEDSTTRRSRTERKRHS